MTFIDLTIPIDHNTPVYPGDKKHEIEQVATISKNGWNEKRITFSSHFGTHIDAPFHMIESKKKLDEFPLDTFIGEATVVDARNLEHIEHMELIDIDLSQVKENDIVLFYTGYIRKMHSDDYFRKFPIIPSQLAQTLIGKHIKVFGLDSFSPDDVPFDIHKIFFQNNIPIIENLINLEKLVGKRFECIILPLKIKDADGAPCRVIARISENY